MTGVRASIRWHWILHYTVLLLLNSHPAGGPGFPRPAGGEVFEHPSPSNSAPGPRSDTRQAVCERVTNKMTELLQSLFCSGQGQVTRGHWRQNFADFQVECRKFPRSQRITREPIELQRRGKAHSIALLTPFLSNSLRFDLTSTVLPAGGKNCKNSRFFRKQFFCNNFWPKPCTSLLLPPSCSSRHDASNEL